MERLTKRVIDRVYIANPPIQCEMNKALFCDHARICDRVGKMIDRTCPALQMVDKLAAYEDTGLEPEEIPTGLELANVFAALEKLKQYEANGTIEQLGELQKRVDALTDRQSIPLPCKVGDKVWANVERPYNGNTAIIHGTVSDIQIVIRVEYGEGRYINFLASDFGETVFINRKEVPQDG